MENTQGKSEYIAVWADRLGAQTRELAQKAMQVERLEARIRELIQKAQELLESRKQG